jgi:FKBP-type peptidyl-prolyl cis-trans isomerase 2
MQMLQVQAGDEVSIVHKGFYEEKQIDGNPVDANGKLEPLKFVVGAGTIIAGTSSTETAPVDEGHPEARA